MVHRRAIVGDPGRGERVVHQDADVEQRLRGADLPAVPVAVAGLVLVVHLGAEVIEAGQNGRSERAVAGQSGAGPAVRLGERAEPVVAGVEVAGVAVRLLVGVGFGVGVHQVRPEGSGGRCHGGAQLARGAAEFGEPALEGFGGGAEPLAEDQGAPLRAEGRELVRLLSGGLLGGGDRGGQGDGESACGARGQKAAT